MCVEGSQRQRATVIRCISCGQTKKFPNNPKHQLWVNCPEAQLENQPQTGTNLFSFICLFIDMFLKLTQLGVSHWLIHVWIRHVMIYCNLLCRNYMNNFLWRKTCPFWKCIRTTVFYSSLFWRPFLETFIPQSSNGYFLIMYHVTK